MFKANSNQSPKAQAMSFLVDLTDHEAKNLKGGMIKQDRVVLDLPNDSSHGAGGMQNAWWLLSPTGWESGWR